MNIEILEKEIIDALRSRLDGTVERELARKTTISRGYINSLKNQKKAPRALSLDTLLKLFPNAQIVLNAESVTSGNYSPIVKGKQSVGINNGTIHNCEQDIERFRHKIQDEIIQSDVERHQKIGRTSFVTFSSCITGLFAGYYGKSRKEMQYAERTNQAGWTECEGAWRTEQAGDRSIAERARGRTVYPH